MRSTASAASAFKLPPAILIGATRLGHALRLPLPLSREEVEAACHYWYFTPARAMAELGFRPRPLRRALDDVFGRVRQIDMALAGIATFGPGSGVR